MKHILLATLILVSSSAQIAFATEDWRAANARPLIESACQTQTVAIQILGSTEPILSCSTNTTAAYASEAFDIADSLSMTSFELLNFRVSNKAALSPEKQIQIEDLEEKLDTLVAKFRGRGIGTLLFK